MIVHHPQWIRVKELIEAGEIGKVQHVDTAFSYDNSADTGNIRNNAETGGGGIRDIGVYTYSSVRFATSAEPVDLTARVNTENGVDTWAQVVGEMDGPTGRFTYSAMTSMRLPNRQEVVFQGEKGTITVSAPFNAGVFGVAAILVRDLAGNIRTELWPRANQYVIQVENFARSVATGAEYPCPMEFSRGTQVMIDRVFAGAVEIG